MVREYRLSEIVQNSIDLDMPNPVRDVLSDIHSLSLDFSDSVVNIRIATYDHEESQYRLYFAWEMDRVVGSSKVAYIAYDKQKHDFFDWLIVMMRESPRYSHQQLVDYFQKEFSGLDFE